MNGYLQKTVADRFRIQGVFPNLWGSLQEEPINIPEDRKVQPNRGRQSIFELLYYVFPAITLRYVVNLQALGGPVFSIVYQRYTQVACSDRMTLPVGRRTRNCRYDRNLTACFESLYPFVRPFRLIATCVSAAIQIIAALQA